MWGQNTGYAETLSWASCNLLTPIRECPAEEGGIGRKNWLFVSSNKSAKRINHVLDSS
jgi:hypothetical protein